MIAKKNFSTVTLALTAALVAIPVSSAIMAGGYGYGSQTGWSGSQTHASMRHTTRKLVYAGSNRHLAWCYNRYRSYRLMDNSFQPYQGPRQECLSPYEQERRALFVGYPDQAPEILFRDQAVDGPELTAGDQFGNLPERVPAELGAAANDTPVATQTSAFGGVPQLVVTPSAGAETSTLEAPDAGPLLKVEQPAEVKTEANLEKKQSASSTSDTLAGSAEAGR